MNMNTDGYEWGNSCRNIRMAKKPKRMFCQRFKKKCEHCDSHADEGPYDRGFVLHSCLLETIAVTGGHSTCTCMLVNVVARPAV